MKATTFDLFPFLPLSSFAYSSLRPQGNKYEGIELIALQLFIFFCFFLKQLLQKWRNWSKTQTRQHAKEKFDEPHFKTV